MAVATVTENITLTMSCILRAIRWLASGDYVVIFDMVDAGNVTRMSHMYTVNATTLAVTDESGNALGSAPAAFVTNLANVKTNVDNALTNLAAAGKISGI